MAETKIICGRAEDELAKIEAGMVDLVFCSPPYEDARFYGIDFKLKGQDWVDWLIPIIEQCLRVCKGLVAIVVEGRTRKFKWTATPALLMADLHRKGICLRKPPAFRRQGIPGSGGPDWLRNDYEFIVCCTNGGKLPWSDNTAMGRPCKYPTGGKLSNRNQHGKRANISRGYYSGGSTTQRHEQQARPKITNPGNIIRCNVGKGHMGDDLAHENEAPFPESLAEFFIRSFCPPDGIVLDPFSGSGTTLAVAEKTGRRWIGIDIRQSEVDLGNKRIQQIRKEPKLFK